MTEKNIFFFQTENLWKRFQLFKKKPEGVRLIYGIGFNLYLLDIIVLGFGINRFYCALSIFNFVLRIRWAYPKYDTPDFKVGDGKKEPGVPPEGFKKARMTFPKGRKK